MNAKKKNKKSNKLSIPNPPQNVESAPKKEDKVEEIQPKCEVNDEILIPEDFSKILVAPVSEIKEAECETPKKPARNKSKNKKQDKEEEKIEVQEKIDAPKKSQDVQKEPIVKVEESQIKTAEIPEQMDVLNETSIVPNARKKKNKKKSQEKAATGIKPPAESIILSKVDSTEPIEKIDSEIQELIFPKPEIHKEAKKTKNKKKNRNDSEKSDKSDNVVIMSCTSAFQNIMIESEAVKQDQSIIVLDAITDDKNTDLELESVKSDNKKVGTLNPLDQTEVIDIPKKENKNKKKNKKDKDHQETTEIQKQDVFAKNLVEGDISVENAFPEEPKQEMKESIQMPSEPQKEREPSPKPSAKIAKPVEKKRKEKQEAHSFENLLNIESSKTQKDKTHLDETLHKNLDSKLDTANINITESQVEDNSKPLSQTTQIQIDNIKIPSEHTLGKKRKKSPTPQKNKEISQTKLNIESEKHDPEFGHEYSERTEINDVLQPQVSRNVSVEISPELSDDFMPLQMKVSETKETLESTETNLFDRPFTPESKADNVGFEIKTSKKKKKSPKVLPTEAVTKFEELPEDITIKKREEQLKEIIEESVDTPTESNLSADIDVQIDRTESDISSCDVIPDVKFIRSSSSQHFPDSNNNTVIQELINIEGINLIGSQVMPIIQGSGETPALTPELGIKMSDVDAMTLTEEKTDIKSKMMEVNQDMEELRLSIERSLAEFTALEKYEKDPEKQAKTEPLLKKEKSPSKDNIEEIKVPKEILPNITDDFSLAVETIELEKKSSSATDEDSKFDKPPPVCPARKDNKGKGKSKKKGKQESTATTVQTNTATTSESTTTQHKDGGTNEKKEKSEEESEQKSESAQKKGKQQSTSANDIDNTSTSKDNDTEKHPINVEINPEIIDQTDFEPIEHFEDALTSSIDDVNKTFEIIAKDADDDNIEIQKKLASNKPGINVTEPAEDKETNRNDKINPVSQPKNLLGHTDIPVRSNRTDYKKEKNKTPNARQAKVKIKDSSDIEIKKRSKESQTDNKKSRKTLETSVKESFSRVQNENDEYIYKYSFRKVFFQSVCHICNKDLSHARVPCGYCNLVLYCGVKHKDEDWPQHQALCFAVSTLAHMKDQKHIYADAQNSTGQDYRLLRMQMIVSCEKVLKRRLVPWEQEIMLYPRMCADAGCREWLQAKLKDCDGCGQLSFCAANPDHLPKAHSRWCKSYSLYQRLVNYQQTKGRLEPRLPTRVMTEDRMPEKMNEVLAAMYEEKIDMNDIQYASLTQLATAPLTTAYCLQLCRSAAAITNGVHKKHPFTIHVVGAELQFEADALNKWEVFFLHLRPDVDELKVVLVSPALNPGNLPLDLLGKIKLCDNCKQNKRRVVFKFEDNKNYSEYRSNEDFVNPDIICAFNPNIQRSSIYNGKDPWPASINTILKLKTPFIITSYTLNELRKDIARIKQVSEIDFKFISEPVFNTFASVRPDRNFISDDEIPLLFKNYCVAVIVGC